MGFYDDFENQPKRKNNAGFGTWIAVSLVSALIGSATTVALVPTLIKSNVIETGSNPAAQTVLGSRETVNVNVQSGVVEAVNKVKPAVVTVLNMKKVTDFFGRQSQDAEKAGSGSGVIFDKTGYIVTNNHVVEGADKVEISLPGKEGNIVAKVVGTDWMTDLAVLKVDEKDIADIDPVNFGNSDALNIGEPAIAIGNPLGQFSNSVTVGVISAANRDLPITDNRGNELYRQTVLQTDAAINPGNSGGALINIKGELIGINSAKIATSGVEGIGFAIPINEAMPIIEQLKDKGAVERPGLGIGGYSLSEVPDAYRPDVPVEAGVLISQTEANADKAGLQKLDVIVKIDDQKVEDLVTLRKVLFKKKPGDKVTVEYYREKELKKIEVELIKLPSSER